MVCSSCRRTEDLCSKARSIIFNISLSLKFLRPTTFNSMILYFNLKFNLSQMLQWGVRPGWEGWPKPQPRGSANPAAALRVIIDINLLSGALPQPHSSLFQWLDGPPVTSEGAAGD